MVLDYKRFLSALLAITIEYGSQVFVGAIFTLCNLIENKVTTVWKFQKFSSTVKIFRQIDLRYNSLVKS